MSLLIDNILKHVALSPQEQELFLSKTETRHYKAKTILLNAGEVCKNSYFINSGILRSFNINDNIVEHVMSFACQGWWISDMYSLISQKPGNLFIEVIEDAEVVLLSKKKKKKFKNKIKKNNL
jgi:CRP-like cAMP-binding protein